MLQKHTTSNTLFEILTQLMDLPQLEPFRLVGGTALSLLKGHRLSVDIDLFTDQAYGTTDFKAIEQILRDRFPVVENPHESFPSLKAVQNHNGLYLFIGRSESDLVKTDILYWDAPFIREIVEWDGIRLAAEEEIGAMKLDVVARGGRKKDFWDLAEIFETYPLFYLLDVYKEKYPYHEVSEVTNRLTDFSIAEEVPDPICLKARSWESVKQRIREEAQKL